MPSPTTLIIVHGTFNPNPDWGQVGSPLVKAIRGTLGDGLKVELMNWTGGNSHLDRLAASVQLQGTIQKCRAENPTGNIVVLGHSHGGNVLFYALRDEAVSAMVDRVICLSTPFLVARERYLGEVGFKALPWFVLAVPLFLELIVHLIFHPSYRFDLGLVAVESGFLLYQYLSLWSLKNRVVRAIVPSGTSKEEKIKDIFESFRLPGIPKEKVLLVRSLADEASTALGIPVLGTVLFKRVGGLLNRLNRWAGRVDGAAEGLFEKASEDWIDEDWVKGGLAVLAIILAYVAHQTNVNMGVGLINFLLTVLVVVLAGIVFLLIKGFLSSLKTLAAFFMSPIFLIASLPMWGFGKDIFAISFLLEMSAEASPPGEYGVEQLDFGSKDEDLSHGLTHSNPQSIAKITEWMGK